MHRLTYPVFIRLLVYMCTTSFNNLTRDTERQRDIMYNQTDNKTSCVFCTLSFLLSHLSLLKCKIYSSKSECMYEYRWWNKNCAITLYKVIMRVSCCHGQCFMEMVMVTHRSIGCGSFTAVPPGGCLTEYAIDFVGRGIYATVLMYSLIICL